MMKKVLVKCCFVAGLATFLSCLKEADLPIVISAEVSNIKTRSAVAGGTITDNGGAEINVSGVCWGYEHNPTILNSSIVISREMNTGSFECNLLGLFPGHYYHVRAFAKNRVGTAYGNEVDFRAMPIVKPKVTTIAANSSFYYLVSAKGNIEIEYDDGSIILERGFCLAPAENPTAEIMEASGGLRPGESASGIYSSYFYAPQPGTLYNVRAYAKTILGITYGEDICIKTPYLPTVTTVVKEFSRTFAKIEGRIIWNEDPRGAILGSGIFFDTTKLYTETNFIFDYPWDPWIWGPLVTCQCPDDVFTCTITDLTPGTLYYVMSYYYLIDFLGGSNIRITLCGNEITFATSQ